jgi:hypothetical protein
MSWKRYLDRKYQSIITQLIKAITSFLIKFMYHKVVKMRIHKTENVAAAMDFMRQQGLKFTNVGATGIPSPNIISMHKNFYAPILILS